MKRVIVAAVWFFVGVAYARADRWYLEAPQTLVAIPPLASPLVSPLPVPPMPPAECPPVPGAIVECGP